MTLLENALARTPISTIEQLGLVHLTVARALQGILKSEALIPSHCEVFDRKLVYLSYGLPYYRPRNQQTEDSLLHPIALAFSPNLLGAMERFYPYDTGAARAGLFGRKWTTFLNRFEELYVSDNPQRLVALLYGSNSRYLRGEVASQSDLLMPPLERLTEFLAQNFSSRGVDQRQRTIECISGAIVPVLKELEWVAYPHTATVAIAELWRASSRKFRYESYVADVNDNPAALVTLVRGLARKALAHQSEAPHGAP
jgi:hypothetical protein